MNESEYPNSGDPASKATQAFLGASAPPQEPKDQFPDSPMIDAPLSEGAQTVIGRYRLLEKIGEGGFGVVYVAEQKTPVRRRVALKIIKLGMDTRAVVARFEAERQALAMMDHPNIAKVFDAGATDTGRPYFVMELVRGIPDHGLLRSEQSAAGAAASISSSTFATPSSTRIRRESFIATSSRRIFW